MLSDSYVKEVKTDTARYLGRVLLMVCIHGHDGIMGVIGWTVATFFNSCLFNGVHSATECVE